MYICVHSIIEVKNLKAVIANMSVSTGGVIRLNKYMLNKYNILPGDRIVLLQDTETSALTLQVQRENKVVLFLDTAEPVQTAYTSQSSS